MSIYLAWSVYKLIGVCAFIVAITGILLYTGKYQDSIKNYKKVSLIIGVVLLFITLLSAFNIGERQQELGRSSFNASAPESVDKIGSQRQDIQSVKDSFEKAVKRTN